MAQIVEIPGIGPVEFPDGMSDLDMAVAAGKMFADAERTKAPAPKDDSSLADWLPAAGGVVGGVAGAVGGPLGAAAGAALGGAGGEGFRQIIRRVQGKSAPESMGDAAADIGVTGAMEGAAGLVGGAVVKGGARVIRGVSKYIPTGAVGAGLAAAKGAAANLPFLGPMGKGAIKSGREYLERRAALGSGRLNKTSRVDRLDDALKEALEEIRTATDAPSRIGGSARPLTGTGRNVVLDSEVRGGMVSTQPDKWGVTTIRPVDDVATTLRDARGGSGRAAFSNPVSRPAPTANKLPSGLTPRALSEGEERGVANLDGLLDAIHGPERVTRGNGLMPAAPTAPRERLARELLRLESGTAPLSRQLPRHTATSALGPYIDVLRGPMRALAAQRENNGFGLVDDVLGVSDAPAAFQASGELGKMSQYGVTKAGRSMLTEDEVRRLTTAIYGAR